jgi:dynein heavy chain
LFDREQTDYAKINAIIKEFTPYSNLWITSTKWFKNIEVWKYGSWETLDAEGCEKFMEDAVRMFNVVSRFFKDRDIPQIFKIAQTVKAQLDQFRP